MNNSIYAIITFLLAGLFSTGAIAREGPFGLGVMIGEPTGLSAKLWTSQRTALDFGLGWSINDGRIDRFDGFNDRGSRIHFHMDYLWHWFNAIHSNEKIPLYTGIGGRINTGAGYESSGALRGVLGIAWIPGEMPIDIFLELAPSLQVVPSTGFGIDAALGARFFF